MVNSRGRRPSKTLPVDVLQDIFEEAFGSYPDFLHCSTGVGGIARETPWLNALRLQKALLLVCKDWHAAALPYIYRHVMLPTAGQVLAFSYSLRWDTLNHRTNYVRSLTMSGFVPDRLASQVNTAVSYIITRCASLQRLSMDHNFLEEASLSLFQIPARQPSSVRGKIVSVNLRPHHILCTYSRVIPKTLYASFRHLTSLAITAEFDDDFPNLSFPSLRILILWDCVEQSPSSLPVRWALPALEDLRFRPFAMPAPQLVTQFFATYGGRITHLDLGSVSRFARLEDVEVVVGACSALKHLVLAESYKTGDVLRGVEQSAFAARPFDYVDVCSRPTGTIFFDAMKFDTTVAVTGLAWKKVRTLDALLVDEFPDLPHIFPPDRVENSRRLHDVFGLSFVQGRHTIHDLYRFSPEYTVDEGSSVDSDYEPEDDTSEDDDDEDEDESTDDDDSDEYEESFPMSSDESSSESDA